MIPDPLPPAAPAPPVSSAPAPALFRERPAPASSTPVLAWGIAGAAVLALIAALLLSGRHRPPVMPGALLPLDPYAASLTITNLAMSESTSLSGGKSTFIDGDLRNTGSGTVTAATVQVIFRNDQALAPQVETLPLTLVRTRDPYIDTQPLAASPLRPGDQRAFRLIFENIGANWNQNVPEIHVVRVTLRE